MEPRRFGLRAALTLLVVIAIAPVFGVVVQSSLAQQRAGLDRAERRLQQLVDVAALQQEELVEGARRLLVAIASAPPIAGDDSAACAQYLRRLQADYPADYGTFGLLDAGGLLACRAQKPAAAVRSSDRDFFRAAVDTGRFAVGSYTVSRASGRDVLPFGMPVYRDPGRRLHGVAYVALDLEYAAGQLRRLGVGPDVTLMVADARGLTLATAGVLKVAPGAPVEQRFLRESMGIAGGELARGRDASGAEWLYAVRPVGRDGGGKLFVAALVPGSAVLAPFTRELKTQLAALALITLVAALLAWTFADRMLLRPMRVLQAQVQALAQENQRLDRPAPANPIREFNELQVRFHGMARSLAERAVLRDAALGEMEHQKRLLEAVLESMSEGVLVLDRHGRFVHVNGAALRILPGLRDRWRLDPGEGDGTVWELRCVDGTARVPAGQWPPLLALQGQPVERFRYRISGPITGGEDKIVEGGAWPLLMNGSGADAAVLLFSDATHAWLAEDALRRLTETLEKRVAERTRELEAANRELESFSYSVSHDLRAPLQVIDGFSHALASRNAGQLDERSQHYLSRIRENTRQMAQLIDDLLALARVTRAELQREPFDLAPRASQVLQQLRDRFPARTVRAHVEQPLPAHGDARLLGIVLENLIGNAWKFTSRSPEAHIHVGSLRQGGRTVYYVRDNGAGFDATYQDKLFKPFQRLHTQAQFEGTGIGLATVHRIVTRHGGRVWAESAPGQETTFFFTLDEAG